MRPWPVFRSNDLLKSYRTTIKHAQILTLPTTSIEVVPAQGVNRAIIPMLATLQLVWVADYTNIDATAFMIVRLVSGPTDLEQFSEGLGDLSGLLAAGASAFSFMAPENNTGNSLPNNSPLNLFLNNALSGDLTGGDPGNRLIVTVFYNVVTLE